MQQWVTRLRLAAGPVLRGTPLDPSWHGDEGEKRAFVDGFADEAGHRRLVDRPLLSAMLGIGGGSGRGDESSGNRGDVELWWMVGSGAAWKRPAWLRERGALTSEGIEAPIEAWTQTELGSLHALWSLANRERREDLRARCLDAAGWFMAEVQPDNGTHHPWAVHVFAWMWAQRGDQDARMYAEALLHNCMVMLGRPDQFSACVLWHAGSELEKSAWEG